MKTFIVAVLCALGPFASGCSAGVDGSAVGSSTQDVTGSSVASIAAANIGGTACGKNSGGGSSFGSSCTGNGGYPEYWCADFARWVWDQAGADVGGLTAAAGSFYVYGQNNGTLSSTPHVGDAVVFDYSGGGVADHVAIVSHVNSNGTIETISGDWGGDNGSEATFSSTSHVVLNAPAYAGVVGTSPGIIGMTISGFVSPAGGSSGACPYGDGYCTDTMQCESGHWVYRYTDPASCTSGPGASSTSSCSYGGGYCTATMQCDNGQWVPRSSDPNACTSGPSASSSSDACSEGSGYCTATLQCENGHWVPRTSDPAACTSGPGA